MLLCCILGADRPRRLLNGMSNTALSRLAVSRPQGKTGHVGYYESDQARERAHSVNPKSRRAAAAVKPSVADAACPKPGRILPARNADLSAAPG
jgi:hypothetical protein